MNMSRKKTVLSLMVLVTMLFLSGCLNMEAGIVINEDGSGEVYNKSLISEEYAEDSQEGKVDGEILELDETATVSEIQEEIDGEMYVGELMTQEFSKLEELTELVDGIEVIEDENTITLKIAPALESNPEGPSVEIVDEDMFADEEMLALMQESMDVKFKVTVPGKILETTGEVEGNTITWDLMKEDQNKLLSVKYEKKAGQTPSVPVPPTPTTPEETTKSVKVTIDGELVDFVDQNPVIVNGRTLVPARMIAEQLGMEVEWDNATRTAKLFNNEKQILITIDKKEVIMYNELNKSTVELDVPAQIMNGRTMLPLRAISEMLDIKVDWDQESYTAILTN